MTDPSEAYTRVRFVEQESGWAWQWHDTHGLASDPVDITYELEWVHESEVWTLGTKFDDGGWNHHRQTVELEPPLSQQEAAEIARVYIEHRMKGNTA